MICPTCAYAANYADTSGMDAEQELSFEAWCETVGRILIFEVENASYYDCEACGETCIGEAYTYERIG